MNPASFQHEYIWVIFHYNLFLYLFFKPLESAVLSEHRKSHLICCHYATLMYEKDKNVSFLRFHEAFFRYLADFFGHIDNNYTNIWHTVHFVSTKLTCTYSVGNYPTLSIQVNSKERYKRKKVDHLVHTQTLWQCSDGDEVRAACILHGACEVDEERLLFLLLLRGQVKVKLRLWRMRRPHAGQHRRAVLLQVTVS